MVIIITGMENENFKVLAALAFGAMGGLLLGNYIWGSAQGKNKSLSNHLAILSRVVEQIENIRTEESEKLKERIENILTTIESSYGDPEGTDQ
jgi:hypothetical protein